MVRCEFCNLEFADDSTCGSCALYNAAVAAQRAAAMSVAKAFNPRCTKPWLNDHGIFAWIDGHTVRVGTAAMAAPFVALTAAVRIVTHFDLREEAK